MTRRHYDPTDALDALAQQQILHGICSEPTCQWPIAGWCANDGCRAKLCYDHLQEHRNKHGHAQGEDAMDDATFQAMIDDEIADEMAVEFFGDDEAAHVAETVDELHAAPAYRISATNLADAIERDAEAVDLDDEGEE